MKSLINEILPQFESDSHRAEFLKTHDSIRYSSRVILLYFGTLVYGSFIFLDLIVGGNDTQTMVTWRVCGIIIMLLGALFFHKVKNNRILSDNSLITIYLMASCYTIIGMLISSNDGLVAALYPMGVLIVLNFGVTTLSLSTKHTLICTWGVVISYWTASPWTASPEAALPIYIYFLIVGSLGISLSALSIERLERMHFILHRQLEKSRDAAVEAKKNQAGFLSSASHELRTPLNAIIGFSEVLKDGHIPQDSTNAKEYLEHIHHAGHNLHAIVNDLLEIHRIEVGKLNFNVARFPMKPMMERAAALSLNAAQKAEVILSVENLEIDVDLLADEGRIVQVITNLITNACKFTKPDGTVTLSSIMAENGDLMLIVKDTGIGISKEDLHRIQKPYEQAGDGTDSVKKNGLGLGLAIVTGILDHVSGRLVLESELNVGTTAKIVIPGKFVLESDRVENEAA